jgi:Cof subfamily protein (haloacid dehalogenase superfamily)
MYRLLAIDLDGTLLTSKKTITARTYAALNTALAAGVHLVIATGQIPAVLQAVCADLSLQGPQILYNGALIVDLQSTTILHERLVPPEYIQSTLATLRDLGLHRVYHTHEHVYVDRHTPNSKNWYRPPVPPAIEIDDVVSIYPQPCVKLVGVGEPDTLREKRKELERIFANQLYVTQASRDLLEFLHPAASKGNALRIVADLLHIAPEEVLAIGDNHNDIGMLRFAGLGIAMGNAHDEVKAAADYVTLSNEEDGVAVALEKKLLPWL